MATKKEENTEPEQINQKIYTFPNGAKLIYFKQNVNDTTTAQVGFSCGSQCDPKGKEGLSHFLEHMLVSHDTWNELTIEMLEGFRQSNSIFNACTTPLSITVDIDTVNQTLDLICKAYSEMLFHPRFTEEGITKEREVISEEIAIFANEEKDDTLIDGMFEKHFYEFNTLGTTDTISNIKVQDLYDYTHKYFHSQNLVMTVVSNLPFEQIKDAMEKHFVSKVVDYDSNLKYQKIVKPFKSKVSFKENLVATFMDPTARNCEMKLSIKSDYSKENNFKYRELEDYILNSFVGRIFQALREGKQQLVYSAGMSELDLNGLILKEFYAITSKNKVKDCITELCKLIRELGEKGITQKELDGFKKSMILSKARKVDIQTVKSFTLLFRYLSSQKVFIDIDKFDPQKLTLDEVNKYLKNIYKNPRFIYEISGDIPENVQGIEEIEQMLDAKENELNFSKDELNLFGNQTIAEILQDKYVSKESKGTILNQHLNNVAELLDSIGLKMIVEPLEKEFDIKHMDEDTVKTLTIEEISTICAELSFEEKVAFVEKITKSIEKISTEYQQNTEEEQTDSETQNNNTYINEDENIR